jgi:hypothetical protein
MPQARFGALGREGAPEMALCDFVALWLCERTVAVERGGGLWWMVSWHEASPYGAIGIRRYGHVACVEHSSGIIIGPGAPAWFALPPALWFPGTEL